MINPYRNPAPSHSTPLKRWGASRYRKWLYLYLRTLLRLVDRVITLAILIGGSPFHGPEMTREEERAIIRRMLTPRKQ